MPPTRKGGALRQEWHRIIQQEPPPNKVPLWLYRWPAQMTCAAACAALLLTIGATLLSAAGDMQEIAIPYTAGDSLKTFTTDAIEGPALLSYQIPDFYGNQKRYVESKDNDVMQASMVSKYISKYTCKDAADGAEARWRRCPQEDSTCAGDPLLASLPEGTFRPCGLVALSLFTDRYELVRERDNVTIALDETGIALDSDSQLYKDRISPIEGAAGAGPFYRVSGRDAPEEAVASWLRPANLEHFQVWYRTPASPSVRNLWAKIPEGLEAGTYRLRITENDRVWTEEWKVPEKRVIISKGHTLGSPGGATFLGVLCLVCGALQVLMLIVFSPCISKHPVLREPSGSTAPGAPSGGPVSYETVVVRPASATRHKESL